MIQFLLGVFVSTQTSFLLLAVAGILSLPLAAGCSSADESQPIVIDSNNGAADVGGDSDQTNNGGTNNVTDNNATNNGTTNNTVFEVDPENTSKIALPEQLFNYAIIDTPAHFDVESEGFHQQQPTSATDNTPADNAVTDAGATLGRVLFYDKNLSANRTTACASCHKAAEGFSDNRVLSQGFDGGSTGRHSMGLTNARYYRGGQFFWDQRAQTLEDQVLMPFQDEVEMGMTLETLVARAQGASYYPELFEAAFGDNNITSDRISKALAQFVRSIVSTNSRYDEGRAQVSARSQDFPNFTASENLGKMLFSSPPPRGGFGCFVCHRGDAMVPAVATSNGHDATVTDAGYGAVTGLPGHVGTFKVPSLRNVELTAPYMHDGRFETLGDVIDHYSEGVQRSANLSGPLPVGGYRMTTEEKKALVAFLKTLTDTELVNDPKFSDPFVD